MSQPPARAKKKYNPLHFFAVVTLLGILVAIWYVTGYLHEHPAGNVTWYSPEACELPGPACSASLGQGHSLTFDLQTDNPRPLELLPISVQLSGYSEAELDKLQLEVDLQGRDMYMGYNRTPMTHEGNGRFTATPLLSLCTEDRMIWRASILINQEGFSLKPTYGSYFDFTVTR